MQSGPDSGRRLQVPEGQATLGRSARCDLVLSDGRASRQHARVRRQGGTWTLEDLGSTNGTYLNEQRVQPYELHTMHAGSHVRVADTLLTFQGEYGGRDIDASDLPRFDGTRPAQEQGLHPLVLWMAVVVAVLLLLIVALIVVSIVAT